MNGALARIGETASGRVSWGCEENSMGLRMGHHRFQHKECHATVPHASR